MPSERLLDLLCAHRCAFGALLGTGLLATGCTREPEPLIKEADAEFEKLLEEEEEILKATREQHEAPHFRPGEAD